MGSELNETQILTAALLTAGIGTQPDGTGVQKLLGSTNSGCLKLTSIKEYTGGLDNIDACYVGETDGSILLAFRGTETNFDNLPDDLGSILDWLNDFKAEPGAMPGVFPGKVHTGFAASVIGLSRLFTEDIQGRLGRSKKTLVVTGYSKGAALAPLASWLLRGNGITVDEVHIYEPPRCGDMDFAKAFNDAFPNALRYEYQDDLVPHTPPTSGEWGLLKANLGTSNDFVKFMYQLYPDIDSWNYYPVGTLRFANWTAPPTIVPDSLSLELARLVQLANDFSQSPGVLLQDHDPNGHLFDAVQQDDQAHGISCGGCHCP